MNRSKNLAKTAMFKNKKAKKKETERKSLYGEKKSIQKVNLLFALN